MGNNISYQTAEYGKFIQLGANTAFPPISVVRLSYPDTSSAFPENSAVSPLSSVDVYPKYAVLTHLTNPDDIKISLSAENINVSLDGLEYLAGIQNAIGFLQSYQLSGITSYVDDLEKNTFDTASACDDVYHETVKLNKVFVDSPNLDAFGRFRISQPTTLFDSKSLYDKGRFFWNYRLRNGDEQFQSNDSSRIATITNTDGFFVKETYRRFPYQPGKSQLFLFTGILEAQEDVIKRVGVFTSLSGNDYTDNTVGIYFQAYKTTGLTDEQSYAWVIRNNTNLVPSQSATQVNWNIDKMDGTGPSGITLDFSKCQIFVMDYEWLGVGRVRCGFNVDGVTHYCHQFLHANNINGTYMTDCNLPIRAEIRSTGAIVGSMKTICASIMTEGGAEDPSFVTRAISLSAALSPAEGNRRGLLGIRLDPTRTNSANEVVDIGIFPQINQQNTFGPFKWELVLRPTPATGRTWRQISANSNIQYAEGATDLTITEGEVVAEGFGSRDTKVTLDLPIYEKCLKLGRNLDGVPDEMWIVFTSLAGSNPIWCSFTVGEAD